MENLTRSTTNEITPPAISVFLVSNVVYVNGSDDSYYSCAGDGSGAGYCSGDGDGCVYGDDYGYGVGYGSGDGSGSGSGYGGGSGSGYGDGYGIKCFCGDPVYRIDGVEIIIDHIHDNIAKGKVLNSDLTTSPCYAKGYFFDREKAPAGAG